MLPHAHAAAIEPAPGTVEALHAVLGGPHLDPAGQYGKIVPSRRDQMRPREICNSGTPARVEITPEIGM